MSVSRTSDSRRRNTLVLGLLFGLGVLIRGNNVLRYPIDMGFDAPFNWQYIAVLMRTWTLPAPDAGWSFAHPPLFYGMGALIGDVLGTAKPGTVLAVRVMTALAGVAAIAGVVAFVRRAHPEDHRRAWIAAALLLFLPVHLTMSAMLSEEILCSAWITLAALGMAWNRAAPDGPQRDARDARLSDEAESNSRAAVLGLAGGLALLTKLTGVLALVTGVAVIVIDGIRRRHWGSAVRVALVFGGVGSLVGGWFYLHNLVAYGYLYPHALDAHTIMFTMPPGAREFADYLRFPLATFSDPQLLSPDLLRSVWGSTFVTIWFDGHRHFLPAGDLGPVGAVMLMLGLLPTTAFFLGAVRGLRRAVASPSGPDVVLLTLSAVTLVGYVAFTWRNPWFVVLKGSFLLGLALPFAYYASGVLAGWTRVGSREAGSGTWARARAASVVGALVLLASLSAAVFCYGAVFEKNELPGLEWEPIEAHAVEMDDAPGDGR